MNKTLKNLSREFTHIVIVQLATMIVRDLYLNFKNRKKEPIGFRKS